MGTLIFGFNIFNLKQELSNQCTPALILKSWTKQLKIKIERTNETNEKKIKNWKKYKNITKNIQNAAKCKIKTTEKQTKRNRTTFLKHMYTNVKE